MDFAVLSKQIADQDWLEWAGLVSGLIYVFLASRQKPVCWIFGIVSSACIGWKSYFDYKLIADAVLQAFYVVIGFIGLWEWMSRQIQHMQKLVVTSSLYKHLMAIAICFLVSIPLAWWLIHHAGARYGYPDTVLTLLSIYATFLLIRKDLHNWWYWIIIDMVYIVLYLKSGGLLFALLFLIYTLFSVSGYINWRKTMMGN